MSSGPRSFQLMVVGYKDGIPIIVTLNYTKTAMQKCNYCFQGYLCVCKARGAMLPLRAHLCICMLLHRGLFWSLNSFPEEQCLVYRFPRFYTMVTWGLGACPHKIFLVSCLKHQKKYSMKGNSCPSTHILLLPIYEGRGDSCPFCPSSIGTPDCFA